MKELAPHCGIVHHHDVSERRFPKAEEQFELADFFKIFGDSTRIRILCALFDGELCVCDIAETLGMTISAISHQLRVLKQARLVTWRRAGKTVYYALADDHIHLILDQGIEHIRE